MTSINNDYKSKFVLVVLIDRDHYKKTQPAHNRGHALLTTNLVLGQTKRKKVRGITTILFQFL